MSHGQYNNESATTKLEDYAVYRSVGDLRAVALKNSMNKTVFVAGYQFGTQYGTNNGPVAAGYVDDPNTNSCPVEVAYNKIQC